jgi:hypothetical protein
MLSICHCLDIFVTETAYSHNNIDGLALDRHKKAIFASFDAHDGFLLGKLPRGSVGVCAADAFDSIVSIVAVGFVDTFDLDGHRVFSFQKTYIPDRRT